MQIKMKFDTRGFDKDVKGMRRSIKHAVKFVVDTVAFDLKNNFKNTAKKSDIVRDGNRLRPYTGNATRYKKSKLSNLTSHVFLNNKASKGGESQYQYLKHAIDGDRVRTKFPKKRFLITPDKTYNRNKSYGQAQRKGGIKRAGDFWLPNRHGGFTLFNRNKGKLNPIWHTSKLFNYSQTTIPYYADMFRFIKKKEKHYTTKLFPRSVKYNLQRFKK